jgi:hypothetical protein
MPSRKRIRVTLCTKECAECHTHTYGVPANLRLARPSHPTCSLSTNPGSMVGPLYRKDGVESHSLNPRGLRPPAASGPGRARGTRGAARESRATPGAWER